MDLWEAWEKMTPEARQIFMRSALRLGPMPIVLCYGSMPKEARPLIIRPGKISWKSIA